MLSNLNSYSITNGMSLNIKKTKIMIFNKGGRHIRRNIYFGENKLESTRQYKYLGFIVTSSGEITSGIFTKVVGNVSFVNILTPS